MTTTLLTAVREAPPVPAEVVAPGRRHTGWVLVCCLALLAAWSGPGLGFWALVLTLLALGGLVVTGAVWLLLLARAGTGRAGRAGRFTVAPLVVLVTAVLLHVDAPGVARFRLTQGAFDQAVHEDGVFAGRTLGSYRIDETRVIGDGTFFLDQGASLFQRVGFAYLPTGPSSSTAGDGLAALHFHHLYGHWYTFAASR